MSEASTAKSSRPASNRPTSVRESAAMKSKPQRRHKRNEEGGRPDIFAIPKNLIPRGYSVEWKRISTLNKEEDPSYHVELGEQGWEPATTDQFPGLMPKASSSKSIVRKGMMLMIRPKELTDEARQEDKDEARKQVKDKLIQLGKADKGEFKRRVNQIKRSYERPPVEDDGIEHGDDE